MRFHDTLGISHALKVAENSMQQKMDKALAGLGLTYPQYAALSALEAGGPLTNAELARACHLTPQTMNRITANLTGFVKSADDPEHGRKIVFTLTAKGAKTICDAHVLVDQIERKMVEGMSPAEVKRLLAVLYRCQENLWKAKARE